MRDNSSSSSAGSGSGFSTLTRRELHTPIAGPRSNNQGSNAGIAAPITNKRVRNANYNIRHDETWKNLPQIKVKLIQLNHKATTWSIYESLRRYGNIVKIEITRDSRYNDTRAWVLFAPPPNTAFWAARNPHLNASLVAENDKTFTVPDPLNKANHFPEKMTYYALSLDFGFMKSETEMVGMYSVPSGINQAIQISLDLYRRNLTFKFNLYTDGLDKAHLGFYQTQIRFERLSTIFSERAKDGTEILVIPLASPPQLYCQKDIQTTHSEEARVWCEWDTWYRQTDVVRDNGGLRSAPISLRKEQAMIDIGRWTTYRFAFAPSKDPHNTLDKLHQVLQSYNVLILKRQICVLPREDSKIWDLIEEPKVMPASASTNFSLLSDLWEKEIFPLSFETRYQLEVCLSHGYLHEATLSLKFLRQLHEMDRNETSLAVGILEKVADLQRRFYDPMEIFSLHVTRKQIAGTHKPPKQCTMARSALVTPTMVYFSTPTMEISNRVIRWWSEHSDRFLRVKFTDEIGFGRIMSQDGNKEDEIFARIKQALRNGIMIGNRKYEFLAFGSSQFRENGAYFFAPTPELSCEWMRGQLGQFHENEQQVPAKVCARIGQNFSTTRGLPYPVKAKDVLEDIERNGFCFTDGVGQISPFLAKMIAFEFGLPPEDAPSVFQFRLGGCKGVLAVMPGLPNNEVHIRPSQYKFAAIHHGLEVIRMSRYVSAVLNRQIISVLSTLGVPDDIFGTKMDEQLTTLEKAMTDENTAVGELRKSVDFNQTTLTLASMVDNGFMRSKDPFMISMLRLWRSWNLKHLKEKAKIPLKDGACLLGCVDETATLRGYFEENEINDHDTNEEKKEKLKKLPEVFCRVDRDRSGVCTTITGICILARNPSLHAGDIRIVKAVDQPQLHHLKNVVVLPQTGDRDLGNMCSGGDLDGDDYLLIWDKTLEPPIKNVKAMNFMPKPPRRVAHNVGVNDMTDFFVDYMKSDCLPTIAHLHMAYADLKELGVRDGQCQRLAQMHSDAVDYAKSGVAVRVPPDLLRNVKWPHFMEKKFKPANKVYHSHKILGQLYDKVVKVDFRPVYTIPFDKRVLNSCTIDEELMNKAEAVKEQYDSRIRKIMAQHDIETEFEVWSAFIMKHNENMKDFSIAEEMGILMAAVTSAFKNECVVKAGGDNPDKMHPFIAAMYAVTAHQVQQAVEEQGFHLGEDVPDGKLDAKRMPLMSFPWLFSHELGKIAQGDSISLPEAHRVQGLQKRHHREVMDKDEDDTGAIETADGAIVRRGTMLPLFGDHTVEEKEEIEERARQRARIIDEGIEGGEPEAADRGRDIQIKKWMEHELEARGALFNETLDVGSGESLTTIAEIRRECASETRFMSDGNALQWYQAWDAAGYLLDTAAYEDLRHNEVAVQSDKETRKGASIETSGTVLEQEDDAIELQKKPQASMAETEGGTRIEDSDLNGGVYDYANGLAKGESGEEGIGGDTDEEMKEEVEISFTSEKRKPSAMDRLRAMME